MAIVASNLYSGRVITGDTGYPLGKAQDIVNGEKGTGTPLRASWVNDQWGFMQALLDAANITPSGTPDQVGQSDYLDAVNKLIRGPLALKIFQSPSSEGLTEIQTRTIDANEVYEVRKTSDDSLATIYSDAAGTTEIVQDGTSNVSGSDGVVEFYIDDGDYTVTISGVTSGFSNHSGKSVSVADIGAGLFSVGSTLTVSDRQYAKFTVVSGGVANGYDILDAGGGNTAEILKEGKMYVEMFGVSQSNDIATNTQAFHAALNFMGGEQIYMLGLEYTYEGSYSGNVNLTGDKRPTVTADRGALENGSVLQGNTNFSGNYVYLCNVGCDHGIDNFAVGADAIKVSANPYNSGRLAVLHGVVGLGRNDTDAFHAVLVEGYEQAWVTETVGARNQFACAIKSRNIEVDGFRSIEGGNGMIVKSDSAAAAGSATNVNISNYTHSGSATSNYGLRVLSDNAQLQRLNINNINITSVDRCLVLESLTALNEVNISNVNSNDIRLFGLVTAGSLFNVNLSNINMAELGDYAGQLLAGTHVTTSNCYFSMKATSPHIDTAFRVESGCTGFSANDFDIVVNRDNGVKGTLHFANAASQNHLSNVRALLGGNIPEKGFTSENVDDGIVNPAFNGDTMMSVVKLSASGATTITEISSTMPNTSRAFPVGYRVILMPVGQTMTYTNGANMRMKVAGDQVRTVNQIIEFVWMGSSWHQVDGTPA